MNLQKSELTMSSREIALITGKEHRHVLNDIKEVEPSYIEVYGTESKFGLSKYTDSTGRKLPEYRLNQSQVLFLASGYDKLLRARIQFRWEELEKKPLDLSDPNVVFELAKNWKEEQDQKNISTIREY